MFIKSLDSIPATPIPSGEGVTRKVLIGKDKGPHFAMRIFAIAPGGFMPYHTNQVEHEQYVLRGKAKVEIGTKTYEVSAGHVVFIPADLPHSYTNIADEPFEFICVVPNLPDETILVDKDCCG